MATHKIIENKIRSIALKSFAFKIGKTGLKENEILNSHKGFKGIESITWSKNKLIIDKLESKMIKKFINWKTNKNKNESRNGDMSDESNKYILYLVYNLKRKMHN